MNDDDLGSNELVEPQYIRFDELLELESSGCLNGYTLAYETYGSLNTERSNAILICHALSGDHHAAGRYDDSGKSNGWWHRLIGPGKPIDTNRFFIVCSNNIGGCGGSTGPSSINPETKQPYGTDFPIVTVKDWVYTQTKLSDHLGISQWAAVVGGSLGGMQAMQWSISYPKRLRHCLLIAAAPKLNAQNIGFNDVARQAIRTDPDFHDGNYYQHESAPTRGMRVARMIGHITYLSEDIMAQKFGRNLRKKAKYFDPAAETGGDLTKALKPATADFLVVSFSSDWRFSPERSREIVRALQSNKLNVSYAEVTSDQGHDSFLLEIDDYMRVMRSYFNRIARESTPCLNAEPKHV